MSAFVVGVPGGAVQTKTVKVGSTQNSNSNVQDCIDTCHMSAITY